MMAEKAATAKNARRTGVIANPFGRWSLQPIGRLHESPFQPLGRAPLFHADRARGLAGAGDGSGAGFRSRPRSEEHTSELQSLMRISYAVFCLKKKKYIITNKKMKYIR